MDRGVGRIIASLEQEQLLDNTLIFFLQDNGGCQEAIGRRGEDPRPATATLPPIPHDAVRLDVIPKQNRAGVPTLTGPGVMPGPEDTYISYGINWANVSNTPFRKYKHFVHEGGISTPLIAHWPLRIQAARRIGASAWPSDRHHGHLRRRGGSASYPQQVRRRVRLSRWKARSLVPAFSVAKNRAGGVVLGT